MLFMCSAGHMWVFQVIVRKLYVLCTCCDRLSLGMSGVCA